MDLIAISLYQIIFNGYRRAHPLWFSLWAIDGRERWERVVKQEFLSRRLSWCIDSAFIAQTANPAIYVVKKRAAAQLNINSEARRWQTGFNLSLLCL